MLFENKQFKIEYICENKEKIHDFIVDIKDFDTPLINIKYDDKKEEIVSIYISREESDNDPKNHVSYKLINLCKYELITIFNFMINHK